MITRLEFNSPLLSGTLSQENIFPKKREFKAASTPWREEGLRMMAYTGRIHPKGISFSSFISFITSFHGFRKGTQCSWVGIWKGVPFFNRRWYKGMGTFFVENGIQNDKGLDHSAALRKTWMAGSCKWKAPLESLVRNMAARKSFVNFFNASFCYFEFHLRVATRRRTRHQSRPLNFTVLRREEV